MLFFSAPCRCGPVKAPPGAKKHRDIPCPDAPRFDFVVSAQTVRLFRWRRPPKPFRFRNGSQTVDSAYFQVITARIPQITAIPIQIALAILLRSKKPLPVPVMAQEIAKRVMRAKRILITFRMTHFFIWFNSFADSRLLNQVYHTLLRISKGRIPPPRWCPAFVRLPFWAVLSQNFLRTKTYPNPFHKEPGSGMNCLVEHCPQHSNFLGGHIVASGWSSISTAVGDIRLTSISMSVPHLWKDKDWREKAPHCRQSSAWSAHRIVWQRPELCQNPGYNVLRVHPSWLQERWTFKKEKRKEGESVRARIVPWPQIFDS